MATQAISVTEASQVSEVRRAATALAHRVGFSEVDSGRAAIVATELATNLVKHGGGGSVLASLFSEQGREGVELIAVDRGPGMGDVSACRRDGHSSSGSAGQGLGAIERLSQFSDIASWPGLGTVVVARLEKSSPAGQAASTADSRMCWGAISTPKPGEEACGDAYSIASFRDGQPAILVADGLGHGAAAAEASTAAVRLFAGAAGKDSDPVDSLERIHDGLRATRGAAIAVALVDLGRDRVLFGGIGNIAGAIASPGDVRRMVSHNGTAGLMARRVQAFEYALPAGGHLILHSDGLSTNWSLDRYPGILAAHPSLIAAVLWRDQNRGRDDATVLVARARPS
ncbi:ATP-binding SpoIIE family protein phosphatase [Alsobacter sp. SYSU BS001988]|jgi:anti-sigma regulatory factor (Ser/Thr protein kinase)